MSKILPLNFNIPKFYSRILSFRLNGNAFPSVKSFQGKLFSRKGKCIQGKSFYGKCFPFYGKSIPMFGSFKHFTKNGIRFTENQFPCLVCGSFYEKYEMPYKFSTCIA